VRCLAHPACGVQTKTRPGGEHGRLSRGCRRGWSAPARPRAGGIRTCGASAAVVSRPLPGRHPRPASWRRLHRRTARRRRRSPSPRAHRSSAPGRGCGRSRALHPVEVVRVRAAAGTRGGGIAFVAEPARRRSRARRGHLVRACARPVGMRARPPAGSLGQKGRPRSAAARHRDRRAAWRRRYSKASRCTESWNSAVVRLAEPHRVLESHSLPSRLSRRSEAPSRAAGRSFGSSSCWPGAEADADFHPVLAFWLALKFSRPPVGELDAGSHRCRAGPRCWSPGRAGRAGIGPGLADMGGRRRGGRAGPTSS